MLRYGGVFIRVMHSAGCNEYMIFLFNFLMFPYFSPSVFFCFPYFSPGLGVKITRVPGWGFFFLFASILHFDCSRKTVDGFLFFSLFSPREGMSFAEVEAFGIQLLASERGAKVNHAFLSCLFLKWHFPSQRSLNPFAMLSL